MARQGTIGTPAGEDAPPLDKRLERFMTRYLDSACRFAVLLTVAERPSRFYSLDELSSFASAPVPELEDTVLYLERLGLVSTKRSGGEALVGLARSPVVRDTALRLFRYASQPGGRAALGRLARSRM